MFGHPQSQHAAQIHAEERAQLLKQLPPLSNQALVPFVSAVVASDELVSAYLMPLRSAPQDKDEGGPTALSQCLAAMERARRCRTLVLKSSWEPVAVALLVNPCGYYLCLRELMLGRKIESPLDMYQRISRVRESDADEYDLVVERLFARQAANDQSKFALAPYQAQDFKTTLKLRESIMEIMTWSPQDLHGRLLAFMQNPHAWETDYSKLLIFVCGNLDEMYVDAASRVEDCDTDADVFHAMTRKLSLIDVKRALSERFKPEQIARLGNNHVIYPSLNRATYQKLSEVPVRGYLQEIQASSGLRFEVTDAVREQIYANAVFSSVHGLMSAPLVDFTLWALEQGATPGQVLTIDVDPDAGLLVSRWGDRMHTVPVALEISRLRQRPDSDMRAILAVHEVGHGLIYALLFQQAPLEIRINMATYSGGYNSFNALKVKTRKNLLDAVCVALAGRAAEEMVFGKESLSSGSESDLKLATNQMAAFIRHTAFGERISHVDVSTGAGENINTDVASTNAEIGAGLQTQYERAQILLAENRAIYLRMVNELINKGQLEPPQIREWLGLTQLQAPNDALEPFEARLGDFEQRVA